MSSDSSEIEAMSLSLSSSLSVSSGSTGSLKYVPQLETNVYRISNNPRYVYRCSVSIHKVIVKKHKTETIELSRAGGADALRIPRQRLCCGIIQMLSDEWAAATLMYEGAATLYSTHDIELPEVEIPVELLEPAKGTIFKEEDYKMFIRDASLITVKISVDAHKIDITSEVRRSIEEDQFVVDFLATLCRREAPKERFFFFRGGKLIDQEKVKDIQFGHLRAQGISMGVHAIRDEERGTPVMAMNIDATEATFFKAQPLVRTINEYFGAKPNELKASYREAAKMREIERYIRDIVVRYEHSDRVFTVTGFKWDDHNNNNGVETWSSSVCKNEEEVKKYAGSAVVTEDVKSKEGKIVTRHYPLDGLHVLPNTKVPKEKQKGQKPKAPFPQQRYNSMHQARKDLNLVNTVDNDSMISFGTQIDREPIRVDQRRLDAPKILGGGPMGLREIQTKSEVHNWNSSNYKFTNGAKVDEMYYVFQGRVSKLDAEAFIRAHTECCAKKGMKIGRNNLKTIKAIKDVGELEATMRDFAAYRSAERAKPGQADFKAFLVLVGEKSPVWHDHLKLMEQTYALQTQHVCADTVPKIMKKTGDARLRDFTLLNIVMKTNVKAGGENVKIAPLIDNSLFPAADPDSPVSLIVGLDVAHPAPQTRHQVMRGVPVDPSCIGVSSNCMTTNLQTFTGYEVYTQSRKEAATDEIMTEVGHHLIKNFYENQKRLPSNVVYFRDGVDKGQYTMVKNEFDSMICGMEEELRLMRKEAEFQPRKVVVLATKRHNIRAYEITEQGAAQNCKAGTVIDYGIVSPYYPEFYLYASHALIGTAKGVQCTILKDSAEEDLRNYPDEKLKDMEKFVHALAFGHQVCDSPTSLPEPLYNAHETAKRGSANSKAYKIMMDQTSKFREHLSHEELTAKLSNRDSELGRVKYNA